MVKTKYVCPYCQRQAGLYFKGKLRIKEFGLDPMLEKIGACVNSECVNSDAYINKRLEGASNDQFGEKVLEILEEIQLNLKKLTGCKYGVKACPACKQWTLRVLDDSAPGGFYAECANETCKKKLVIDRT